MFARKTELRSRLARLIGTTDDETCVVCKGKVTNPLKIDFYSLHENCWKLIRFLVELEDL